MRSLIHLLSKTARGKIFLINLHEALCSAAPCLDIALVRDELWTPVRKDLGTADRPRRALEKLFDFLHAPANRGLRFQRTPATPRNASFEILTTTRPGDLLYDEARQVLKKTEAEIRLGRHEESEPWTARQGQMFEKLLSDTNARNGRAFAERYDIFWATPEMPLGHVDADTLRDHQGLVHINREDAVIQLRFECGAHTAVHKAAPHRCAGPTVIEATNHRRFKARLAKPVIKGSGTALDLERMRAGVVRDGAQELTFSAVPMTAFKSARFVGFTKDHPDITAPPTELSKARDDRRYAQAITPSIGLAQILADLNAVLEAPSVAGASA